MCVGGGEQLQCYNVVVFDLASQYRSTCVLFSE